MRKRSIYQYKYRFTELRNRLHPAARQDLDQEVCDVLQIREHTWQKYRYTKELSLNIDTLKAILKVFQSRFEELLSIEDLLNKQDSEHRTEPDKFGLKP